MRLEEIESSTASERRVKQLKSGAKAAKDRAKQLQTQADSSAERLDIQKSRQKLKHLQTAAVTTAIKPYK